MKIVNAQPLQSLFIGEVTKTRYQPCSSKWLTSAISLKQTREHLFQKSHRSCLTISGPALYILQHALTPPSPLDLCGTSSGSVHVLEWTSVDPIVSTLTNTFALTPQGLSAPLAVGIRGNPVSVLQLDAAGKRVCLVASKPYKLRGMKVSLRTSKRQYHGRAFVYWTEGPDWGEHSEVLMRSFRSKPIIIAKQQLQVPHTWHGMQGSRTELM